MSLAADRPFRSQGLSTGSSGDLLFSIDTRDSSFFLLRVTADVQKIAEAQLREARAQVKFNRAALRCRSPRWRMVALEDVIVSKADFPTTADNGAAYLAALRQILSAQPLTITRDRLQAELGSGASRGSRPDRPGQERPAADIPQDFRGLLTAFVVWGGLPVTARSVTPAAAQDQEVRFLGRVSWVAGDTLVVSTGDSPGVRVDLTRVDQAEYQGLAAGDLVVVTGIIPYEGDRVVATSIKPHSP
jgi:hypothetical protein